MSKPHVIVTGITARLRLYGFLGIATQFQISTPQSTIGIMAALPSQFILTLPKAELHLHLEGTIDPPTLLELRRRHGKKSDLAEVQQLYRYDDFPGFLMAFKSVTEDLRTPEDYELITYRLMQKLKTENVLHAEVYVSVGVCLWRKQDFDAIFEGLERGRQRGQRDFGISLLWIFDAVRQFGPERRPRSLRAGCPLPRSPGRRHWYRRRRAEGSSGTFSRRLQLCRGQRTSPDRPRR